MMQDKLKSDPPERETPPATAIANGVQGIKKASQLLPEYSADWISSHPIIARHYLGVTA